MIIMTMFLFLIFGIEFCKVIGVSFWSFLFLYRLKSLLLDLLCFHISDDICEKPYFFTRSFIKLLAIVHIVHILILTFLRTKRILISINYGLQHSTIYCHLVLRIRVLLKAVQQHPHFSLLPFGRSLDGTFHSDHDFITKFNYNITIMIGISIKPHNSSSRVYDNLSLCLFF